MIIDEWDAPIREAIGHPQLQRRYLEFLRYEQALRSVIKRAYFSYGDEYVMFEELPAGTGYADVVYLPKRDAAGSGGGA